jgi:hypothetical protein
MAETEPNPHNLSMAGCGFLGIYHIGVAACLEKHIPGFKSQKMAGASAGAMAAVYFLCGVPPEHSVTDILHICRIARSNILGLFSPNVNVTKILRASMERHLPEDAHLRVNGKIHISLTRCHDFKNFIISEFESREDLIQAVLCSGFIPLFSGMAPPKFRGARFMDGGWSDNLPILNEHTITVSPFSGESDICPRDHINLMNVLISNTSFQLSRINFSRVYRAIFPPKQEELFNTFKQGFTDTAQYLLSNDMITCSNCEEANANAAKPMDYENNNVNSEEQEPSTCYECETKKSALFDPVSESMLAVLERSLACEKYGMLDRLYPLLRPASSTYSFIQNMFVSISGNKFM